MNYELELLLAVVGGIFLFWYAPSFIWKCYCVFRTFKKQWKYFEDINCRLHSLNSRQSENYESCKILDTKIRVLEKRIDELAAIAKRKQKK